MTNRLLLPACAMLIAATAPAQQLTVPAKYKTIPPKPTTVVARVNGQAITAADIEPLLWNLYFVQQPLDDAMSAILVAQDAAKHGIVISDAEIDKAVNDEVAGVKSTQGGTTEDAMNFLRGQGFTKARLYLRLKTTILIDKIVTADFHPENFVNVSTILVKPASADASVVAEAIKKCQDAYDKLKAGTAWDTVLASATSDQKMIAAHGALGWRDRSLFPDSAQKELATLPIGGFTHPVQTQFGIQIFRLDGHGAGTTGKALTDLKNSYMAGARTKYMSDLKQSAKVEILVN